ncbi:DNA-binding transcriptional regulator, MocR family, contains an aminotransferase domain [Dyadobacter soli]|uniref:DNA-binding transcriptional regulator, MocR family, contains an aminotransferase domain n=1 Tax=Dyadobacter soli TaxID=659014 RepID=A0A1G7SHU9_9BACT|nr:PLP-dependent aminotransferase family protein [Dyadobacter soli]SDG22568.1 DNA-binding transcriptional regulator, MocR family, contains an aminotransferase domain [Dyadobacter soli]
MRRYKFEIFTDVIEQNIREGIFKPGQKLPSVRELKHQYQTSTSTIQSGYEYLIISGLVESIPKSGYYVANKPDMPVHEPTGRHRPVVRDAIFKHHLALTTSLRAGRRLSEFNVAAPGDLLIPQKLLLRTMQQTIREHGAGLLRYYPPGGSAELRSNIIQRAAVNKTIIHPDELLITDGALQALYIALASVCKAGDVIAIESPCVFSVLEVIRVLDLKVVEVPVTPHSGFDIDFLSKACRRNRIKAALVTPNFHNPTGTLLNDEKKVALVAIAREFGMAIIENDIYGDLHFQGTRPSTIRSFDDSGIVITYSSYAKTLAAGLRLGWLAAGKWMQRAEQIRFALGSTVSPVYQETVNRLLSDHSYDRHVRAFRMQLARNAHQAIQLISEHFPEKTFVHTPAGGYNAWVKMPDDTDMNRFYEQCEQIGVRFTPGYTFSFSGAFDKYFRLVFADKFSPEKIAAIQLAGQCSAPNLY